MLKCLNATKILPPDIGLSNGKIVASEVVLRVIIAIALILYSIIEDILRLMGHYNQCSSGFNLIPPTSVTASGAR